MLCRLLLTPDMCSMAANVDSFRHPDDNTGLCCVVQGRFKRAVAADALMIGQEFVREAENPWMAEMLLTAAAKAFSNSTKVSPEGGRLQNTKQSVASMAVYACLHACRNPARHSNCMPPAP